MATEYKRIILRKGVEADLPELLPGEPAYTTDTKKVFVGTGVTPVELQPKLVSGTSIKTINQNSILGSGDISLNTLTAVDASDLSAVSFEQVGGNTITEDFTHTHTKSDITDFTHTHTKSEITDFTHTHTVSDITDFSDGVEANWPTPSDIGAYTTTEVDTAISTAVSALVDSAPGTLNTLNELAAALGDDENFATTVTDAIGANTTDIATNATDIATNATAIATNTADIATNATAIATNATAIATKVAQADYDDHIHRTGRYFLGSVSSEDLPNAVNFTQLAGGFTITSSTILLYRVFNPSSTDAAGNIGTLWLNIQTGEVFRLVNLSPPTSYFWESVGNILDWVNISALDANTYYGFSGVYFSLQDGANPSQGTFLYVPNINAIQTTIDNDQGLYIIKYSYYDSVADTTINQTFVTHPTFIGWEDINDVYNIPGYNSGFVEISSQFLTGGVYNILFPTPVNPNDIQQIYFYGITTVSVTETQYVF